MKIASLNIGKTNGIFTSLQSTCKQLASAMSSVNVVVGKKRPTSDLKFGKSVKKTKQMGAKVVTGTKKDDKTNGDHVSKENVDPSEKPWNLTVEEAVEKKKNNEKIDFELLSEHRSTNIGLLLAFADEVDWDVIARRHRITVEFINKCGKYVKWENLSQNPHWEPVALNVFEDNIDFELLSTVPTLNAQALTAKIERFDMVKVSQCHRLDPGFIAQFKNHLCFKTIGQRKSFVITKLNDWASSLEYSHWLELLSLKKLQSSTALKKIQDIVNWDAASVAIPWRINKIREFADKINWTTLCESHQLTEKVVSEFFDKIDWVAFSRFQLLTSKVMERHKDKLNWKVISEERMFPKSLRQKYATYFDDAMDTDEE